MATFGRICLGAEKKLEEGRRFETLLPHLHLGPWEKRKNRPKSFDVRITSSPFSREGFLFAASTSEDMTPVWDKSVVAFASLFYSTVLWSFCFQTDSYKFIYIYIYITCSILTWLALHGCRPFKQFKWCRCFPKGWLSTAIRTLEAPWDWICGWLFVTHVYAHTYSELNVYCIHASFTCTYVKIYVCNSMCLYIYIFVFVYMIGFIWDCAHTYIFACHTHYISAIFISVYFLVIYYRNYDIPYSVTVKYHFIWTLFTVPYQFSVSESTVHYDPKMLHV